ncbi:MAG: hypothetical protein E7Z84_04760 [Methanosphaera stadtmanae]|nr:hypothetical protein [Methanosphaera stadtmanae]
MTHDEFHGSLIINECNGHDTLQFVHGFPKMYFYENQVFTENIKLYEKLDGSCICVYKLYDENGEIIEYVPKSRQKAVLDKHFIEMYKLCDKRNISQMNENIDSIYMELYGMLNQHTIPYYKTYIDLALLGAYTGKKFLNDEEITKLSKYIQIKKPEQLGIIHIQPNEYKLELVDKYYTQTRNYNNKTGKSLDDILGYLKEYLDKLNTINITEKGKIRYEGAVLRDDGNYIKSKPKSYFEAEGRIILNVSPGEVKKEIHKILDERSELLLGDYDEKKVIEEININLEEEYDKTDVYHPRVQKMVLKQLHEFIETLPSKSLQNTVNDLIEENPGLSIGEYMQKFSRENPLLKHKSRLVYNMIIKKL